MRVKDLLKRTKFDEIVKKIFHPGSFIQHVSIASSWNLVIILIQFLLSPIITRIYTPDQYGVFAVFSSIIVNISMLGSFKYNEAIVLAPSLTERNNVASLSGILVLGITLLSAIGVLLFFDDLASFLGQPRIVDFIYFIPLGVALMGAIEILLSLNVWSKRFFHNGLAGFFTNLSSRIFTILFGLFVQPVSIGLIGGDLIGKFSGSLSIIFTNRSSIRNIIDQVRLITIQSMMKVMTAYKHFPLYILPTSIIMTLSNHLPIYFFQAKFSSSVVGAYALSTSLLEIVNRLIPYSIAGVFFSKAAELKNQSSEQLANATNKVFKVVFVVSLFIFLVSSITSRYVFPFIFGDSWQLAGIFAGILSVSYATNFINVSLLEIYKVISKQRLLLNTTIISVVIRVLALVLLGYAKVDAASGLFYFCLASALGNILQTLIVLSRLNLRILPISIAMIFLETVIVAVAYFVNIH
jgi:lipopolysaccharide exporter